MEIDMELPDLKPLEWNRRNADGSIHIATALPGEYWSWELAGYGYWSWGTLSGTEVFGGIDGAKAAAQADYEQRFRSALATPAPVPADIAGLVERWTALAELYERDAGDTEAALFRETASEYTRMAGELREANASAIKWQDQALRDLGRVNQLALWKARAEAAEASLAEALKALEPFAEMSKRFDDAATSFGTLPSDDLHKPLTEFTHAQLRAARKARLAALGREGEAGK
jgi:hypothetical protein